MPMNSRELRMDKEFDQYLVDMKPYVLRLLHKTERQRCALWIKKLCEPKGSSAARKNRNVYAKLLLIMLKRGSLDGPFVSNPEEGSLPELPSYMGVFMDDSLTDVKAGRENTSVVGAEIPDWANLELNNSSLLLNGKTAGDIGKAEWDSFERIFPSTGQTKSEDIIIGDSYMPFEKFAQKPSFTFRDEQNLVRMHEKELEMKTKLLEAQFHEEKMKLQHKHDLAVQQILQRKNGEIDELKANYKAKDKDTEENKRKLEKRLQAAHKEMDGIKQVMNKKIEDLQTALEETTINSKAEYDSKVHELTGQMEREKYELQKSHTKNIQELLDDTNHRLSCMEEEYCAQAQATKLVINELENRVQQLSCESESMLTAKQILHAEKEKVENELNNTRSELECEKSKFDRLSKEYKAFKVEYNTSLKSVSSKHKADLEYLKQEQNVSSAKHQSAMREVEDQLQALKHSLQDSEQQRIREIREKESLHQQDIMSMQHLHDKQIHGLRTDFEEERCQMNRKAKALEDTIKDREDQMVQFSKAQKQSSLQAEQAIESFKKEASSAQQKVYSDMRVQLEKMELDLEQSRQNRDKIIDEYQKEIEELKCKQTEEISELKMSLERDKEAIIQDASSDRDCIIKEYENQLSSAEVRLRSNLEEQEKVIEERQSQHQHVVSGLEQQIRELRQELVNANALRRQQLVELGLLREEERQKMARDNDVAVTRLEAEIDRQRAEMHQQHAAEMQRQGEKLKNRLDKLDSDYKLQLERAHERLSDAQRKENDLKEQLATVVKDTQEKGANTILKLEEEQNKMKSHQQAFIFELQSELEVERQKAYVSQRDLQKTEYDLKDQITRVKLQYEERMKGMLPKSVKEDFEETISCLKSQIKSLQQKNDVLQESAGDLISLPGIDSELFLNGNFSQAESSRLLLNAAH